MPPDAFLESRGRAQQLKGIVSWNIEVTLNVLHAWLRRPYI